MEHTQNTRLIALALALAVAAGTGSLAACATATPASESSTAVVTHRALVRAGAERYVADLMARARIAADRPSSPAAEPVR